MDALTLAGLTTKSKAGVKRREGELFDMLAVVHMLIGAVFILADYSDTAN